MDPLSIAGSIAGLVSLADLVFRATAKYIKCVKEGRKDVRDLLEEVKRFSILLHNLSLVASELEVTPSSDDSNTSPSSDFRSTFVLDCQQVLGRIKDKLEKAKHGFELPSTLSKVHNRLKWPFSTTDTADIIQTLQRHRQMIGLALSADSLGHLKLCLSRQEDANRRLVDVQSTVHKILDIETKVKLGQIRQKILNFFTNGINPRTDFEMNKNLRHPETSLWFTRSDDFKEWQRMPGSRIWISGIPGAGKSVLAGTIITECLHYNSLNDKTCSAYFFCTYRDKKTQLTKNVLSSLASQIARQNEQAFQILEEYYESLRSDNDLPVEPSANVLLEILAKMSACFDQIFLVVDGVDECETKDDDVVQILAKLATLRNSGSITTAIISRDMLHIRQQLEVDFTHIEIEAHTEDIELYVACEIEKLISMKKLRIRDLSLKDQIMTELINNAKGMFQWVACQLDHLCDLPTDRARREALSRLPPTLPATYERILYRVEKSNEHARKLVQKSLQLIALSYFGHERLNIQQICEAVSVPDVVGDSLEDDEIIDEHEIIKWCGSLIRKSANGQTFDFAHFSVQEFLTEICRKHATLKSYHISEGGAQSLLGPLCLKYLLLNNHARSRKEPKDEVQYILNRKKMRPFYEYSAMWWPKYAHDQPDNKCVAQLIQALFDNKTTNFTSWMLEFVRHCLSNCSEEFYREQTGFGPNRDVAITVISAIKRPDFTPLHMASVLGLSSLCSHLLENGANLNLESRFGTPLHCAVGGLSVFSDSVPIPDHLNIEGTEQRILLPSERYKTVQLLLASGTNTSLHFITPFQQTTLLSLSVLTSSSYGDGFRMAAELIRAGAIVEEEDHKSFSSEYKRAISCLTPKLFKEDPIDSKAVMSLLEVTGISKGDNDPRSSLYSSTYRFAKVMEIEFDESICDSFVEDSASYESLCELLETAIVENDIEAVQSCINRMSPGFVKTVKFKGVEKSFPGENWTALHVACYEESRDVLNILLEAGCDVEKATQEGRTPIQLCRYDQDGDTLKILLNHGASSIKQDKNLKTIWHMAASSGGIEPLKQLVTLDPDRDVALRLVSSAGRTPVCEALAVRNEEAVHLLMQYCPTTEYWKSDMPLFRQAAQLGSLEVVQKLLNIGAVSDKLDAEAGSPLHYIAPHATVECVKALVEIFPHRHVQSNGRTPFQSLLARAVDKRTIGAKVQPGAFKILLLDPKTCTPNEVGDMWEFFCSTIVPYAAEPPGNIEWLTQLLSHLLSVGFVKCYELDKKRSALVPFVIALNSIVTEYLPRTGNLRAKDCDDTEEPLVLDNWKWMSQVVSDITKEMVNWDIARTQPSVTQLLSLAIIHDDAGMMQLLLENGVDMHRRVNTMSALELACIPEVSISKAGFRLLLSHIKTEKLLTTNESADGLNIVHITADAYGFEDDGLWKLQYILAAGANCNIVSTNVSREPALCYHLGVGSLITANALLDSGADPWQTNSLGFNAALTAIIDGDISVLAKIAAISRERNLTPRWDQTWKSYHDGQYFSGGNSFHIAAMWGQMACLEFYINENLLSDLEILDDDLQTPMHYAARFGQLPVIRFLKERGCDINPVGQDGTTPLHLAVKFGHLSVARELLAMGAESKVCILGLTPLSYAHNKGDIDMITLLRSREENISPTTSFKISKGFEIMAIAFCAAMERNDTRACADLHKQGFPIDYQLASPWSVTPLMLAVCKRWHPNIIEWLVKHGSKVSIVFQGPQTPQFLTILEAAIATPIYNDLLPLLLASFFQEGGTFIHSPRTPVHAAVHHRNHKGLMILLDRLEDEDKCRDTIKLQCNNAAKQNHCPDNLLHSVINHRNKLTNEETALHSAASFDDVDTAELLINKGADINLRDGEGYTALHRTVVRGSTKVSELLLERGADLEPLSFNHHTPLMEACHFGQLDMVKLLLKHGDPSVTCDLFGNNLLKTTLNAENNHISRMGILDLLLRKGISIYQTDIYGTNPAHHMLASAYRGYLKIFLRVSLTAMELLDIEWPTSWMIAWVSAVKEKLDYLTKSYRLIHHFLGRKQPLRLPDSLKTGKTSLCYLAASRGHVTAMDNVFAIGVDLEFECCEEGTALMIASANGNLDTVKYLVRKEARLWYETGGGHHKSAFAEAASQGHEEVLCWLLVGRHVEQPKIGYAVLDDEEQIGVQTGEWSGIQHVELPLKWEWKQRREEGMFEYALRRQEIISEFRGTVVDPGVQRGA